MEKKETIKSITFILSGALLQMFGGIGSGWGASLTAIFGLILFFVGLSKLKKGLDNKGKSGVSMLIIAAIIGIIAFIFDIIPTMGIIASILFIAGFVIEFIGFLTLRSSDDIGTSGEAGVVLLLIAMILGMIVGILGFVPLAGGIIGTILSIVGIILVFFGWLKIQDGIITDKL